MPYDSRAAADRLDAVGDAIFRELEATTEGPEWAVDFLKILWDAFATQKKIEALRAECELAKQVPAPPPQPREVTDAYLREEVELLGMMEVLLKATAAEVEVSHRPVISRATVRSEIGWVRSQRRRTRRVIHQRCRGVAPMRPRRSCARARASRGHRTVRSSARSGDSGDSSDGEPGEPLVESGRGAA